jgi:hypothetical protein
MHGGIKGDYSMKKRILTGIAVALSLVTALLAGGCGKLQKEIVLSFDKTTAYFTSSVALLPIAGETPAAGDSVENATVKIAADSPAAVQVSVELLEGDSAIEGLKIAVNGSVFNFEDKAVIFMSAEEITEAELNVSIFLNKDADVSVTGKTLSFRFVLSGVE